MTDLEFAREQTRWLLNVTAMAMAGMGCETFEASVEDVVAFMRARKVEIDVRAGQVRVTAKPRDVSLETELPSPDALRILGGFGRRQ